MPPTFEDEPTPLFNPPIELLVAFLPLVGCHFAELDAVIAGIRLLMSLLAVPDYGWNGIGERITRLRASPMMHASKAEAAIRTIWAIDLRGYYGASSTSYAKYP
jgi:hypothetical protein